MDGGHEERRRPWGRIFPRARIASPGRSLRTVESFPLSRALLLRSPRRPRFHDVARLWQGLTPPARRVPPGEETQIGWPVEPRCAPPRRRRDHVRVVPETSEANANAVRARICRCAEQADHPDGDECARTIESGAIANP